jgi:hypothetical protein
MKLKVIRYNIVFSYLHQVIVAGVPKPEVQWLRDEKELKKGKRVLFEEEAVPEGVKYKMTIRDIVMKDFGKVFNYCKINM